MHVIAAAARVRLREECAAYAVRLRSLPDAGERVAEEVHGLRKTGKSLRGGFELFGLGGCSARQIQAVGRLLAGRRDAVSRRKTWGRLGFSIESCPAAGAIEALLDQAARGADQCPPREAVTWCVGRVEEALEPLLATGGERDWEGQLTQGVARLQRQVRKRLKRLPRRGVEDFHDVRKALKGYLGALGFLACEAFPADPRLAAMAERLGDENDLATLAAWLEEHGFRRKLAPEIWKKLLKTRRKLQDGAVEVAAGLIGLFR